MEKISKKIYFPDSQGHKLCGVLESVGSERCVIISSGYPGSHNLWKDKHHRVELAETLNKAWIDTFRYDHYGVGESEGKRENLTVSLWIDGVISAIDHCKNQWYKKIALYGSSFWWLSVLFAALKEEVKCVVALAPVGDYYAVRTIQLGEKAMKQREEQGRYMYEEKRIPYNYLVDAKKYIIVEHAHKLDIPVLIMHGDQDDNVPIEQSKKLVEELRDGELVIFEGEGHGIKDPVHKQRAQDLIVGFMEKYLS